MMDRPFGVTNREIQDIAVANTLVERYLTQSIADLKELMERGMKDDNVDDQRINKAVVVFGVSALT